MTRLLSKLAAERTGVQFHITSLRPLRPENAPFAWEIEALQSFEQGAKEWARFSTEGDRQVYRYMAPLFTEEPCLKCHRKDGYQLGDVRGGSVSPCPSSVPYPWLELMASHALVGIAGVGFIGSLGQRLQHAQQDLRRQAVFDALTNIPNRRFFIEHLFQELQPDRHEQRPLAPILCDIDDFKGYNDALGQEAGDHCLRTLAAILDKRLGGDGRFCARYGGEEFVAVLTEMTLDEARALAERLRVEILELGIWHPASPHGVLTLSIGIAATSGRGGSSYETLIQHAEAALARAKTQGRNRVEVWL
ncbi:diguanylate cyclase [Caldichromatium japonicum]|uniref:diguanylate cyclase n=1 Tax=Caldichromatium japonicum TaxID=2699430 RepID=A0A6G7VAM7_9GAMM|nr:diguanylate cyclase [Caldichromatium japonicum]QIK36925.1 diguanylate cyclase [Caldichromatium japonicum]